MPLATMQVGKTKATALLIATPASPVLDPWHPYPRLPTALGPVATQGRSAASAPLVFDGNRDLVLTGNV